MSEQRRQQYNEALLGYTHHMGETRKHIRKGIRGIRNAALIETGGLLSTGAAVYGEVFANNGFNWTEVMVGEWGTILTTAVSLTYLAVTTIRALSGGVTNLGHATNHLSQAGQHMLLSPFDQKEKRPIDK